MDYKPGWKTTEFYVTLITNVVALLVVYNVLSQEQAAAWIAVGVALVPAILGATYTWSRTQIKAPADS